jgi:hypothetical protein
MRRSNLPRQSPRLLGKRSESDLAGITEAARKQVPDRYFGQPEVDCGKIHPRRSKYFTERYYGVFEQQMPLEDAQEDKATEISQKGGLAADGASLQQPCNQTSTR